MRFRYLGAGVVALIAVALPVAASLQGDPAPAPEIRDDYAITVHWKLSKSPLSQVTGYQIFRGPSVGNVTTRRGTVGNRRTWFVDYNAPYKPPPAVWVYQIVAFGPGGRSARSAPMTVNAQKIGS